MRRFENKATGILSSSDLKSFKNKLIYWVLFAILVFFCIISLFPAIWTILTAFKDTQEIYNGFSLFPQDISPVKLWNRISESWNELQFGKSFISTVVLSLGNLVSVILVSGLGGYVLSKMKPKGSKFIFVLVVWTMMMPGQMRIVPNYITSLHFPFAFDVGGVSLLDTYWPMWLSAGANAFNVILFKNAFDALSDSYVEAAKLDGCNNFGIFFRIMLPLSMPIIIFVSIGTLSSAWSDFFGPLLYFEEKTVLPLSVYRLQFTASMKMNTKFMAYVFASIPPFLIFAIFQKRIMGGVNIGGVKE